MNVLLDEKEMESNSNLYRMSYFDYFRFWGIILMIMGHIGFGVTFDKWIHSFHMPMFFFISGFFCNINRNFKTYIIKKVRTILIPYAIFGLFYVIVFGIMSGEWEWQQLIYPNYYCISLNGALWFLPSLLFCDVISFIILKYANRKMAIVLLFLIANLGTCIPIKFPFAIDSAMVGVGFYLGGFLIKNYGGRMLKINGIMAVLMLIGFSIIAFNNDYVNMRTNEYGNVMVYWGVAYGIIIAFLNIFRIIAEKVDIQIIKVAGQNSLIYVCTNQIIIRILGEIIVLMGGSFNVFERILELFFTVLICYSIDRFLTETPLKFILGKQ